MRRYPNGELPQRMIGRFIPGHHVPQTLTVCDFFLWRYTKNKVYVPPLPIDLEELKTRVKDAANAMTQDMIDNVWEEF
jgi:hypothetical protein